MLRKMKNRVIASWQLLRRLRRSICGKAVLFRLGRFLDPIGYAAGGRAASSLKPRPEKHSFSANRRAKPASVSIDARSVVVFFVVILFVLAIACAPNRRIVESSQTPIPPAVNAAPAASSFETDLQAMRNADFKFILVFRRKDNAVMDSDDKSFVNINTPPDANRKKLSDDGKAIIVGSNFPFFPGTIVSLTDRFLMEDYSKPDSGPIEVDRMAERSPSPTANTAKK